MILLSNVNEYLRPLHTKEAAEWLGISQSQLTLYARQGDIEARKVQGIWYFSQDALAEFAGLKVFEAVDNLETHIEDEEESQEMKDINVAIFTGHVTRDSELRVSQNGMKVLNFSVAVNSSKRDPNDATKWIDVANFIPCVLFGERAEAVQKYVTKGAAVTVKGELRYSSWDDNGTKRSAIEVVVDLVNVKPKKTNTETVVDSTEL